MSNLTKYFKLGANDKDSFRGTTLLEGMSSGKLDGWRTSWSEKNFNVGEISCSENYSYTAN